MDYNDALDDQLQLDGNQTFSGGVDAQMDPAMVEPMGCADWKNMSMNRFGVAGTRKGISKVGSAAAFTATTIQGLAELDTPTIEKLIAVSNGAFKYNNAGTWTAIAGHTANASAQVCMAQGINLLHVVDGVNNLMSFDGANWIDNGNNTTNDNNPPICKWIIWHTYRLFAAGHATFNDTVYVSNILKVGAGQWPLTFQFQVGAGEGDAITAIFGWTGHKIVVFKHNSFYVINADPQLEPVMWTPERISSVIGCVSQRSVAQVGNDVYFLSRDGVRSIFRTTNGDNNEVSLPLSWPMQPYVDRINWTYAHTACATFYDNKYLLAVPLDSATTPNYILVYDTRAQKWSGYWTGWTPTIFHMSKLANLRYLYFGQSDGKVLTWNNTADEDLEATFLDDGTGYASMMTTRAWSFSNPVTPKSGWSLVMEFYRSQATVAISAILDQGGANVLQDGAAVATQNIQNSLPLSFPFDLAVNGNKRVALDLAAQGEFREMQVQLASTTGKLSVKNCIATAFFGQMPYEEGT